MLKIIKQDFKYLCAVQLHLLIWAVALLIAQGRFVPGKWWRERVVDLEHLMVNLWTLGPGEVLTARPSRGHCCQSQCGTQTFQILPLFDGLMADTKVLD